MVKKSVQNERIGKRVEFVRYGNFPPFGISTNYRDDTAERGLNGQPGCSVYLEHNIHRSEFLERDKVIDTAILIGVGSDGEGVIDPRTIKLKGEYSKEIEATVNDISAFMYDHQTYNQWV